MSGRSRRLTSVSIQRRDKVGLQALIRGNSPVVPGLANVVSAIEATVDDPSFQSTVSAKLGTALQEVTTALASGNSAGIPLPMAATATTNNVLNIALSGDASAAAAPATLPAAISSAVSTASNTTTVTGLISDDSTGGSTSGSISAGVATSAIALALFGLM